MSLFMLPGGWELWIILLIILLLFGSRIPTLARSMGQGITEFKKGLKGDDSKKQLPGEDASARGKDAPGHGGGSPSGH